MEIKEPNCGHMSNGEVLEFLQNSKFNFKRLNNFREITHKVRNYLSTQQGVIPQYTDTSYLELDKKVISLLKAKKSIQKLEILQIINNRPSSLLDLQILLENCDTRFTEEELELILQQINTIYRPYISNELTCL